MSRIHSSLLFAPLVVLLACSGTNARDTATVANKVVVGRGTALNRSVQQITDGAKVPLFPVAMNGTYGTHCSLHPGEPWTLSFTDGITSTLEVALDDSFDSCPLTVDTIEMSNGAGFFLMIPPVRLDLGYAAEPSPVLRPAGTLAFYANAGIFGLGLPGRTYSDDFAVLLVYSDDARAVRITAPPAIYNEIPAVAGDSTVPPPHYRLGFDGLKLVVDSNKVVKSDSSGSITMTLADVSAQTGEEWRIFEGTRACCASYSFGSVDAIYTMQVPIMRGTIPNGATSVTMPWTSFGMIGTILPGYRTLIVKHTGDGGVHSYQLFQVLFPGPAGPVK